MNILVTGGAGFIGRWVIKKLLDDGHKVVALDNLSNGRIENIQEFKGENFKFVIGDIRNDSILDEVFGEKYDLIYHLASSINSEDSIEDPKSTFLNDTLGTFNILEKARIQMFGKNGRINEGGWVLDSKEDTYPCKVVFASSCIVYDSIDLSKAIDEKYPIKPSTPYAGSKIAAENMILSYYNTYKLPTVIVRAFNTYGPFQKTNGEGGVVAIFINNTLHGKTLNIYGSGQQTRDLIYVKDCAKFLVMAGYSDKVNGEIINVGTGRDVSINELADIIAKDKVTIKHVKQANGKVEIRNLKCNCEKAKNIMKWKSEYSLEKGLEETEQWIRGTKLLK